MVNSEQNLDGDGTGTVFLCPQLSLLLFGPLGITVGFERIGLFLYGVVCLFFQDSQDEQLAKQWDVGPAEGVMTRKWGNKSI